MSELNSVVTTEPSQALNFQAAYDRVLPEIEAIEDDDLIPMNIDLDVVYTTVSGSLPRIRAFRSEIDASVKNFDFARFDKLEDYARAMTNANGIYDMASKPAAPLPALVESATAMRERLYNDTAALANRGLIDGTKLKELRGPVGFRNVGFDLLELSILLRSNWSIIENKTPLTLGEIDEAHRVSDRLLTAVGDRDQSPAVVAKAAKIRHKAFTNLVQAYDQARRVITYLRWDEGDVDAIAPSLYSARQAGRRKGGSDLPKKDGTTTADLAGVTGSLTAPANTTPNPIPVGMPGSSPFANS